MAERHQNSPADENPWDILRDPDLPHDSERFTDVQYNPEIVSEIVDTDTNQPVFVVTIDKFLQYDSGSEATPFQLKRLLTALCSQAHRGNDTIGKCLHPKPWDSFMLTPTDKKTFGIKAEYAPELYAYITDTDSDFTGFHQGASVSKTALEHFHQIVENLSKRPKH